MTTKGGFVICGPLDLAKTSADSVTKHLVLFSQLGLWSVAQILKTWGLKGGNYSNWPKTNTERLRTQLRWNWARIWKFRMGSMWAPHGGDTSPNLSHPLRDANYSQHTTLRWCHLGWKTQFLKFVSQKIAETFKGKWLAEGSTAGRGGGGKRNCNSNGQNWQLGRASAKRRTQAGIRDWVFLELKQGLRVEQEEQACSVRTQSILPYNLSYTEPLWLLIITSLHRREASMHSLLKTAI